ncbi:MAG TPA: hypothetical protein PKI47_09635 [Fervidobacterium sp.]|nr:hypothetical protein [Fervidobacterium sp.]
MKNILLDYVKKIVIALLCLAVLLAAMMIGAAISSFFLPNDEFCGSGNENTDFTFVRKQEKDRYVTFLQPIPGLKTGEVEVSVHV